MAASPVTRDLPLDGLRGVAVLLVIGLHLGWIGVGWIGVQLFFVLSGFVITRVLLADAQGASLAVYLRNFYMRRALRILPALYLGLVLIALVSVAIGDTGGLGARLSAVALFYYNFYLMATGDGAMPDGWVGTSTGHLWSLAVEEHFYLLWPLVVYWAGPRRLLAVTLACILLGPLLRWAAAAWFTSRGLAPESGAMWVYLLTSSHVDAFATGALIAQRLLAPTGIAAPRAAPWLLGCALAYLCGALINQHGGVTQLHGMPLTFGFPAPLADGAQYVWGYSLLNLLFAQLIVLSLRHPRFQALTTARPLVFTGRISYGLYLLHFPPVYFYWQGIAQLEAAGIAYGAAVLMLAPLYLATIIGLACLSFHYFETPFLARGRRWRHGGSQPVYAPDAAASAETVPVLVDRQSLAVLCVRERA